MADPFSCLRDNLPLTTLAAGVPPGALYLVGGAIRDALLARPVADFDLTSPGDPTPLASDFARRHGGHWFWLDRDRRQSRVLIDRIHYDFAPFRAATLVADLAGRDFTLNAMALDLSRPLSVAELIDPLDGQRDLAAGVLRCAGEAVLLDDPLRVLKGIRHGAELGLEIPRRTAAAMQLAAPRLATIAPERLRLEVWRILAAPLAVSALDHLAVSGAGTALFSPGFAENLPAVRDALAGVQLRLAQLAATSPRIAGWLRVPIEAGFDRATLLGWCAALAPLETELPLRLARRWKFSRAAQVRIDALQRCSARLYRELASAPCRPRPLILLALRHGPDPLDLLLFLAASSDESETPTLIAMLEAIGEFPDPRRLPDLVDGDWLREELGLSGPAAGTALADVREAEVRGEVGSAEEARRFLRGAYPKRC